MQPGQSLEHQLICPITHEQMTDPIVNEYGQTYERAAYESWLTKALDDKNPLTDPYTGQALKSLLITPNYIVKGLLEKLHPQPSAPPREVTEPQISDAIKAAIRNLDAETFADITKDQPPIHILYKDLFIDSYKQQLQILHTQYINQLRSINSKSYSSYSRSYSSSENNDGCSIITQLFFGFVFIFGFGVWVDPGAAAYNWCNFKDFTIIRRSDKWTECAGYVIDKNKHGFFGGNLVPDTSEQGLINREAAAHSAWIGGWVVMGICLAFIALAKLQSIYGRTTYSYQTSSTSSRASDANKAHRDFENEIKTLQTKAAALFREMKEAVYGIDISADDLAQIEHYIRDTLEKENRSLIDRAISWAQPRLSFTELAKNPLGENGHTEDDDKFSTNDEDETTISLLGAGCNV